MLLSIIVQLSEYPKPELISKNRVGLANNQLKDEEYPIAAYIAPLLIRVNDVSVICQLSV